MDILINHSRKILIGIAGGVIVLIGLVLVPYPGPGWLIVFSGLAVLGTEFHFARRIRLFARRKYDDWTSWLKHQSWFIRVGALALTATVVVVTLWLMNTFGFLGNFFGLDQFPWLTSPLFR